MAGVQTVGMKAIMPAPIDISFDALSEEYLPGSIAGRETQLKELQLCVEPSLRGWKPSHAWLYGPPGSGKSTVARHIQRQLAEQATVKAVYVDCGEHRSFYTVVDRIVEELRLVRSIERGVSFKLAILRRYAEQKPLIVILDEIHLMQPVAMLSALHALAPLGKLGLICVSTSKETIASLDEPTHSRLLPMLIRFPPYSADELSEIIGERASKVIHQDEIDDSILSKIADLASGNARVALQLLRTAGLHAEHEGIPLSLRHLEAGFANAKDFKRDKQLGSLSEHHQLLYSTIRLHQEILAPQLMDEYSRRCRQRGLVPISRRSLAYYLKEFVQMGWLKELPSGKQSGAHLYRIVD